MKTRQPIYILLRRNPPAPPKVYKYLSTLTRHNHLSYPSTYRKIRNKTYTNLGKFLIYKTTIIE